MPNTDTQTIATEVIAAASKTPFRTAFMITLGIGLGRVLLLGVGVLFIIAIYKLLV